MQVHSAVSICNVSLALIGEQSIRDFDESNKRARMCDNFYHHSLTYNLTKHDWSFARRYCALNELILTDKEKQKVPEGLKVYEIPSDCLIPRNLAPRKGRIKWEVMGNKIYTKEACVGLYYTHSETRPEEFTDTFVRVMTLDIASKLAGPLTQDKNLTNSLFRQYLAEAEGSYETDSNIGDWFREGTTDQYNDSFINPDSPGLINEDERNF